MQKYNFNIPGWILLFIVDCFLLAIIVFVAIPFFYYGDGVDSGLGLIVSAFYIIPTTSILGFINLPYVNRKMKPGKKRTLLTLLLKCMILSPVIVVGLIFISTLIFQFTK